MKHNYNEPSYPISIAARRLEVCLETLRIWERKGLIRPQRLGKNRFYSDCDLDRLRYIKDSIQAQGINIQGVKALLAMRNCWDIKDCDPETRRKCSVYRAHRRR